MRRTLLAIAMLLSATGGHADPQFTTVDQALVAAGLGARANLSCGIPPIPPIGCKVGACVCDQYGQNCQWQFICG